MPSAVMLVVRSRKPARTASTPKKGCAPSRRDRIGRRPAGVEYPARSARLTRAEARRTAKRGHRLIAARRAATRIASAAAASTRPSASAPASETSRAGGERDDEGAGFEAERGEREQRRVARGADHAGKQRRRPRAAPGEAKVELFPARLRLVDRDQVGARQRRLTILGRDQRQAVGRR